jgi:hypothetical protein
MSFATRFAACVLLVLLGLPSAALAQDGSTTERAAREYDAGTQAFERREFRLAARAFESADTIAPHARTRYNAALSWDRAGDLPRAADAYSAALDGEGLDQDRVRAARTRLEDLFRKLGALDVRRPVGGKVSVAHVQNAAIPARIHVAPGIHRLSIERADGTREQREIEVRASERVVLEIAITTAPLAPVLPSAPRSRPAPAPAAEREPSSSRASWGYVALGGAVVLAAGAVFLGVQTFDAIDDFDRSGDRDADARARAVRYRALGWTAAGASVACATLGVVLLSTGDLDVAARGANVSARYRF